MDWGIPSRTRTNWLVDVWYIIGDLMSKNNVDATEEWLLNEATQEEIEKIAND